jgi:hypothetical protein
MNSCATFAGSDSKLTIVLLHTRGNSSQSASRCKCNRGSMSFGLATIICNDQMQPMPDKTEAD